jgi:hypothetical protein
MKSEEPSHSSRNNVGKSGESVPIATAQVFSNYVLVPAARHPGEAEASARLHGTALLVFGDESAEKVQLRTGYATHVAGDAALWPRENACDEIVSGHDSPQIKAKEIEMISRTHCSACKADLQPGNQFCPGCGLQLTAQAAPTIHVEGPRYSLWAVIVAAIGLLWLVTYLIDLLGKR